MFDELDRLLAYNDTTDYWYDEGFCYAQNVLANFSGNDWKQLSDIILSKYSEYQKKLVYCLDGENEVHELEIIEKLISVDDEEFFIMCVDSLRNFDSNYLKKNQSVIDMIKAKSDTSKKLLSIVSDIFLEKVNNEL